MDVFIYETVDTPFWGGFNFMSGPKVEFRGPYNCPKEQIGDQHEGCFSNSGAPLFLFGRV